MKNTLKRTYQQQVERYEELPGFESLILPVFEAAVQNAQDVSLRAYRNIFGEQQYNLTYRGQNEAGLYETVGFVLTEAEIDSFVKYNASDKDWENLIHSGEYESEEDGAILDHVGYYVAKMIFETAYESYL